MKHLSLAALMPLLLTGNSLAHGISAADRQAMLDGGYIKYIWLGASHMLTGYDHLLFIFGVIFFLRNARDIVKFITAFTLGHSITLIFATLFGITANYYLVDAVIALSVCYKGFENLEGFRKWLDMKAPNLLGVIFAFGLVHGFGLSTRLQQLPLGDDRMGLFLRIISFNVGVEFGQIAALSVMIAIIAGWRHTRIFDRFTALANGALVAAGIVLLFFQLHGYIHTSYPDDFPLNKDDHHHTHEDLELQKRQQSIPGNLMD